MRFVNIYIQELHGRDSKGMLCCYQKIEQGGVKTMELGNARGEALLQAIWGTPE